jgi:hypothetical protein
VTADHDRRPDGSRFEIDADRTALDVTVHPSLFGFGVHITGLTGELDGTLLADGSVDLTTGVTASVRMNIDHLDLGSPWLTRATHGALGLAGDGWVSARLLTIETDEGAPTSEQGGPASDGGTPGYRFTFDVESGRLRGRLQARCRIVVGDGDGSATVTGVTEFRASDFDVHLPGLDHLRGVCDWTVVMVPST